MKKNLGKILVMAVVAVMMMATVALADAAVGEPAVADNVVTVSLSGLPAGEATILVVKDGVDPSTLTSATTSNIVYIDQVTVDENGAAEFDFDASAAVAADATADVYVDIYCGYTNMTTDTLASTAKVFTYVAPEPEYVIGDIDGDGAFTDEDSTYLFYNYLYGDEDVPVDYPDSLDFDNDGAFTDEDSTYLFYNYLYGDEDVPLYPEY